MSTRSARRSPKRTSSASGKTEDCLVSIIVTQIGVCIFLLVLSFLMKTSGGELYTNVKTAANQLIYHSQSVDLTSVTMEDIETFSQDVKSRVEEMLGEAVMVFNQSRGGQGGMFPVEESDLDASDILSPPEGATLAPIVSTASFLMPVEGEITSPFGYRIHPTTEKLDFHMGVDIAAPEGKAIKASLGGVVTEIGESDIYGNYVIVKHSESLQTFYAHCTEIVPKVGDNIRRGLRIATIGSTGISTGPHLHFGVMVNDIYVDPAYLLSELAP